MRANIHPEVREIKAICSCGKEFTIESTRQKDINLDICSNCHPFYTGRQKMVDTARRIKRFEERYYRGKKKTTEVKNDQTND